MVRPAGKDAVGVGRLNILILSQYFWPESFLINDLALGLQRRGHELTVLTGQPNYPGGSFFAGYPRTREESYEGIRVARVPMLSRGKSRGLRLVANYASFALSASLLGPWKCRAAYDAMIVFQPSPVTVGLPAVRLRSLRGIPLLFWVQDLWPDSLEATGTVQARWLLRQVDALVRYIYRRCDRVLVQSPGFANYVARQQVPSDRIRLMPNWAEAGYQPLELAADAAEQRELPAGFRITYGGNLGVSQSLDTLLEAAERTRHRSDVHWVLIGDGREKERLTAAVRAKGLTANVHLLGRRDSPQMPRYFAASDALLVSLKRDPTFARTIPSKVQAYLACGRPILACLEGDGADVIRAAGAGHVCGVDDGAALASAALRLADTPKPERERMGAAGRNYYEQHFAREVLLQRWDDVLQELTEERRACAA